MAFEGEADCFSTCPPGRVVCSGVAATGQMQPKELSPRLSGHGGDVRWCRTQSEALASAHGTG